ncbi:hypothetical protein D9M68_802970 [compost metagenome]
MGTAGHHIQAFRRHFAAADRLAPSSLLNEGATAPGTGEQAIQGRRQNHTQYRLAVLDQGNVDGELTVAADEFPGAVQRVHQPETLRHRRYPTGRCRFLGDHWNLRSMQGQGLKDQRLGALVGLGHRRRILLAAHLEIRAIDLPNQFACRAGNGDDVLQQYIR